MDQTQSTEDQKLTAFLTEARLRDIYTSATNIIPSPLTHSTSLIYEGMLTRVSLLKITPSDCSQPSVQAIAKRYVPQEEQTLTFAGGTPVQLIDQREYKHLDLFHAIDSRQPRPYFHDPEEHLVVMEALDCSFHDLLDSYYTRFAKASRRDRERIRTRVREDIKSILERTAQIFTQVTRDISNGSREYELSILSKETLFARHDRGLAAIVNLGVQLDLSEVLESLPLTQTLKRVTPGALAREAGSFFNRFGIARERERMFSYLLLQEAAVHGDLLPGNVLYRNDSQGRPSQFSICDLGIPFKAPFDFDMIALLMVDPRIKLMLSLQERQEIYHDYFPKFAEGNLLSSEASTYNPTPDERFAVGSVAALLRYMGAIYSYLDQKDPQASVKAQGDLSLLEHVDPHLPFKPDRYFGIQYASLVELLHTEPANSLFPNLNKGVNHFFDSKTRSDLTGILGQDTRTTYQKFSARLRRTFKWLSIHSWTTSSFI